MSRAKKEYIIYDVKTDLPVFIGGTKECMEFMGATLSTFHTLVSRRKSNPNIQADRYEIFDMDMVIEGHYLEEGDNDGELYED